MADADASLSRMFVFACMYGDKIVNYFLSAIYFLCVDFGFSNYYMKDELFKTFCGSPPYAAPEAV